MVTENINKNLLNMFALINTFDSDKYNYYVIGCQRAFYLQIKKLHIKFSNLKIIKYVLFLKYEKLHINQIQYIID